MIYKWKGQLCRRLYSQVGTGFAWEKVAVRHGAGVVFTQRRKNGDYRDSEGNHQDLP
jgi:hypothetical protein